MHAKMQQFLSQNSIALQDGFVYNIARKEN